MTNFISVKKVGLTVSHTILNSQMWDLKKMPGPQINAAGVYLKLNLVNLAFNKKNLVKLTYLFK